MQSVQKITILGLKSGLEKVFEMRKYLIKKITCRNHAFLYIKKPNDSLFDF